MNGKRSRASPLKSKGIRNLDTEMDIELQKMSNYGSMLAKGPDTGYMNEYKGSKKL